MVLLSRDIAISVKAAPLAYLLLYHVSRHHRLYVAEALLKPFLTPAHRMDIKTPLYYMMSVQPALLGALLEL